MIQGHLSTSSFKNRILKAVCAMLIASILVSLMDHILAPKYITENQDGRITREFYEVGTDLDVIALGSSTMYNAFSPDYLWGRYGFTSYVRSNASQTLWQSYYLLKDAFDTKHPSLVVLDMSFIKYGDEFIEEPSNRKTIESMRNPLCKYGAVKASMYEEEDILSYYFPVLRYHSRWKELTSEDLKYSYIAPRVTFDGYLMDFTIPDEQNIYEPDDLDSVNFPEKSLEYLDKIIELCKKENVPILLMKTPTYVNSWHGVYDDEISKIANAAGVSYVNFDDYADECGIVVRTDYIDDGSHLNIVGAEKFCDFFGAYIKDNYELADHRQGLTDSDKKICERWNAALSLYEEKREAGMSYYEKEKQRIDL